MNDAEFGEMMHRMGADRVPLIEERALHRAGFLSVGRYAGVELFRDPEDPHEDGGLWIGREEAMRRIRVRVGQAKAGHGPLIERGQCFDPFDGAG